MHTSNFCIDGEEYIVHHNGDWSGDAYIGKRQPDGSYKETTLPGKLLIACGRQKAFSDVVSAIEELE